MEFRKFGSSGFEGSGTYFGHCNVWWRNGVLQSMGNERRQRRRDWLISPLKRGSPCSTRLMSIRVDLLRKSLERRSKGVVIKFLSRPKGDLGEATMTMNDDGPIGMILVGLFASITSIE